MHEPIEARVRAALADLERDGLLERVNGRRRADRDLWLGCDLASMVEGCFGDVVGPERAMGPERAAWLARLDGRYRPPRPGEDERIGPRYFLLDDGARAGTVIVAGLWGHARASLFALYTRPEHRGRGVASRLLDGLAAALARHGVPGFGLHTYWTWIRSVRFYLARGLWVWSWEHDIAFVRDPDLPRWRLDVAGDDAVLAVDLHGAFEPLLQAGRRGDRLTIVEAPLYRSLDPDGRDWAIAHRGWCTLAVALAARGWPLVRSPEDWARRRHGGESGPPEGLAYKIERFEAVARDSGWRIDTPRIPGLAYRDLDDVD